MAFTIPLRRTMIFGTAERIQIPRTAMLSSRIKPEQDPRNDFAQRDRAGDEPLFHSSEVPDA